MKTAPSFQRLLSDRRYWRGRRKAADTVSVTLVSDPIRAIAGTRVGKISMNGTVVVLLLAAFWLRADQVQMQNGDHYFGKVLALDANTLVLRSEVLGTVTLPRSNVVLVTLGAKSGTNLARVATNGGFVALTNGMTDLSASPRRLGANTNLIQQVQAQYLADAGPEANNKFNEMVNGLLSGKLTVKDIRAEAKAAADQLKELKRDLGEDGGGALDGYLTILESFLQQTAPPSVSATNVARPSPKAKPKSTHAQD